MMVMMMAMMVMMETTRTIYEGRSLYVALTAGVGMVVAWCKAGWQPFAWSPRVFRVLIFLLCSGKRMHFTSTW